jgi:hypothetical protein
MIWFSIIVCVMLAIGCFVMYIADDSMHDVEFEATCYILLTLAVGLLIGHYL